MSTLVDRAIDAAGLAAVATLRRRGPLGDSGSAALREADLLALGAFADRVRRDEVGDEVWIYAPPPADGGPSAIVLPDPDREMTGLELLREVAIARVTGPRAARVRVDWTRCGLELAQVAIGFGANELVGQVASKRGLPMAEGELLGAGKKSQRELASVVKRRELAGFIRRAGRVPVFVGEGAEGEASVPASSGDAREEGAS